MKNHRQARRPHCPKAIEGVSLPVGPGGTLCACCFPAPGSKGRKILIRHARRKAERIALKEQMDYMEAS